MSRKTKAFLPTIRKSIVLGSGPIRIGQGVEFDYATVHCVESLRSAGYEAIIINNNPETVSTDFSISDKLYFEPLTTEDVMEVSRSRKTGRRHRSVRRPDGHQPVQLPLPNTASRFSVRRSRALTLRKTVMNLKRCLKSLISRSRRAKPRLPLKKRSTSPSASAIRFSFVRPDVLGGRAMEIVHDDDELVKYMWQRG